MHATKKRNVIKKPQENANFRGKDVNSFIIIGEKTTAYSKESVYIKHLKLNLLVLPHFSKDSRLSKQDSLNVKKH